MRTQPQGWEAGLAGLCPWLPRLRPPLFSLVCEWCTLDLSGCWESPQTWHDCRRETDSPRWVVRLFAR